MTNKKTKYESIIDWFCDLRDILQFLVLMNSIAIFVCIIFCIVSLVTPAFIFSDVLISSIIVILLLNLVVLPIFYLLSKFLGV